MLSKMQLWLSTSVKGEGRKCSPWPRYVTQCRPTAWTSITSFPRFSNTDAFIVSSIVSQNPAKRLSGTCACMQIMKDTPRPILWRSPSAPQLIRLDGQPFVRFVSLSWAWCYVHVGFWARFRHTSSRQHKITISDRFIKDHEKLLTKVKFVTWAAPFVSL